jgi:glucose/arabinose dehydrogenase
LNINLSSSKIFETFLFTSAVFASSFIVVSHYASSTNTVAYGSYEPVLRFAKEEDEVMTLVNDPNLHVAVVAEGLELPTTMAFLGPEDIFVLEKEKGTVQRIINGTIQTLPVLDVNISASVERCMCGIAISKDSNSISGHTYVFLYYTEAQSADRDDINEGKVPLGNRLYRYELVNGKLVNPNLVLDLPALPGPRHNGGAISLGLDNNNLYIPIGDVDGSFDPKGEFVRAMTQNYINSSIVDGRSGILEVSLERNYNSNKSLDNKNGSGILGDKYPLNLYYAYGIRNSFGIDFDPITGNLWDTENGPAYGDEINLVKPGFNSGYTSVHGIWSHGVDPKSPVSSWNISSVNPEGLVDFNGKGEYSLPEFTWVDPVGVTAIKFFNSSKYGEQYEDDVFVADVHNGNIYRFKLNEDRTELVLAGSLSDRIANTTSELDDIIFGRGFGGITDLEVGPDGYLYVVSIGQGKIFRIES